MWLYKEKRSLHRDGKCTKKIPKAFAECTTTGNDSYPIYQRRNIKRTVQVYGLELDNRWVVHTILIYF